MVRVLTLGKADQRRTGSIEIASRLRLKRPGTISDSGAATYKERRVDGRRLFCGCRFLNSGAGRYGSGREIVGRIFNSLGDRAERRRGCCHVCGEGRWICSQGIFTFKGIPYGDTTEGANRFIPPAKPKGWSGVRSSRQHGPVAPQGARAGWANDEDAFMFSWDDGIQGEDRLRINLWSPGVNDNKKHPVMVWLHGGGFAAGSGQELLSYDGENLARRGDVVVVTLSPAIARFHLIDME
jgi:hypothetical protein